MQEAGAIFLGNTPGPARSYMGVLLSAMRKRYKRLVIPACGKFAIAEVAINVGWRPDRIECSDVALFSSVLGYLAAGKALSALQVSVTPPPPLADTLSPLTYESAGQVLYALKLLAAAHHAKTYWDELVLRELARHRDKHIDDLENQAQTLARRLSGMSYEPLDMWEHMAQAKDDPKALSPICSPARRRWSASATSRFCPSSARP